MVIDPKLGGSLSLLIQTSLLRENGVELRHISADPVQTDCSKVLYLVRPQLNLMKLISSNIQNDISKGVQREYFVYFVPRRTVACEKIFEDEKVHHMLTFGEYPLYVMPLDEDVLSFELDLAYKECQVEGDTSSLWHVAKGIHKMEFSFGVIPNIRAKGKSSTKVAEILNSLHVEEPVSTSDILQINNGAVEVDAGLMVAQQEGKKIKVPLNSSDKLYKEIRDLHFEVVVQVLRQKTTSMQQDYADIKSTSQSVSELKDFVKKMNSIPEITRHINLAQHLQTFTCKPSFHGRLDIEQTILEAQNYEICLEYIEEMIHKQESLINVLRLLVLFSITNSGLPKKNFDYLRREILHSYGFEHMVTLYNLEKAGLFKKQESKSNWPTIAKALQLIVEDVDTANPNDIAYIFSGYAPLSIRIVQHAIRSGWRSVEEIIKLLPGPHLDIKRGGYSNNSTSETMHGGGQSNADRLAVGRRSLTLVVFIGGVTFAEIAALRFLSSQVGLGYDFIVAATKIVSGTSLLETMVSNAS